MLSRSQQHYPFEGTGKKEDPELSLKWQQEFGPNATVCTDVTAIPIRVCVLSSTQMATRSSLTLQSNVFTTFTPTLGIPFP